MLLLNIDTATEHASVCLTRDGIITGLTESTEQKNHASFVQPAIDDLLKNAGCRLNDLDAVAVTIGPGSYTGLRVGLASAKGICFALDKPLITINTLQVMAQAAVDAYLQNTDPVNNETLFCPLIDARRMEVFTATYRVSLEEVDPPHALIIDENSFSSLYNSQPVVFSGSGRQKLADLLSNDAVSYSGVQHHAGHMTKLAGQLYEKGAFADLAYCEPLYVKEFFDTARRNG